MNIFQKIRSWFGTQYVILIHYDGDMIVQRAYKIRDEWYSNPYLPETRTLLLPNGKTKGQSYVIEWKPVTDKINEFYEESK